MFGETAHVETAERSMRGELIDVESLSVFKMSEPLNCCVSGCLNYNNFRNSSGLHYYRIPKGCVPWTCQKTNETRVVCSGDMEEDANNFEFQ